MTDDPEILIADVIDAAEDVREPSPMTAAVPEARATTAAVIFDDAFLARAKADPGETLKPAVLAALSALSVNDYETIRWRLRHVPGVRVTVLDREVRHTRGDASGDREPTQAEQLLALAADLEFFHTPDGKGFADVHVNGHRETWSLKSKGFSEWLKHRFYLAHGGAPHKDALSAAVGTLLARAKYEGAEQTVYLRAAWTDDRVYLDLCDDAWRAVEVTAQGWCVVDCPPVRFRRAPGMAAQPLPERGGTIHDLRRFLNASSEADFVMAVSWLHMALSGRGPFPVYCLAGEHGSAKSTVAKVLRRCADPASSPLKALPADDRDFFIAANSAWVLSFDNLSHLSARESDTLCRLATGGGYSTRELYSDDEETIFEATRPQILNGITDIATRADLADRALFHVCPAIRDDQRTDEAQFWEAFTAAHPQILGALLDGLVVGLRERPTTTIARLPRMADFALWATACETAHWPAGTFMAAYARNQQAAVEAIIAADLVASAVRAFMEGRAQWRGTATELLALLIAAATDDQKRAKDWPKAANALSGALRRAAGFLRRDGLDVDPGDPKSRPRRLTITRQSDGAAPPEDPAPSAPDGGRSSSGSSGCSTTAETLENSARAPRRSQETPIGADRREDRRPADSDDHRRSAHANSVGRASAESLAKDADPTVSDNPDDLFPDSGAARQARSQADLFPTASVPGGPLEPVAGVGANSAQIPFMITRKTEAELRQLGYRRRSSIS